MLHYLNALNRAVIKRRGPRISPNYYERFPQLLSEENRRKIEPKEIPSCLIPRLLIVFTQQLEILVTTLLEGDESFVRVNSILEAARCFNSLLIYN